MDPTSPYPTVSDQLSKILHDLIGATWSIKGALELLVTNWDTFDEERRLEFVTMAFGRSQDLASTVKDLEALDLSNTIDLA